MAHSLRHTASCSNRKHQGHSIGDAPLPGWMGEGFTGERKKGKRKHARQSNKRVYSSIFEIYARSWTFRGTCTRPTLNLSEKGSRVEICSWPRTVPSPPRDHGEEEECLLTRIPRKHRIEASRCRGWNKDTRCTPPDNEPPKCSARIPPLFPPLDLPDLRTVAAEFNASSCPLSTDDKEQGEEFICHGSKMCTTVL